MELKTKVLRRDGKTSWELDPITEEELAHWTWQEILIVTVAFFLAIGGVILAMSGSF